MTKIDQLNQEQSQAVNHWGSPLLVLAGAGSGKTRVLTQRVVFLAQKKNIPLERIVLLTFTNKAAGEMKERVNKLVGQTPGFAGTFHSYCARLLRRFGQSIGLDPDFVIYDEDDRLAAIKMAMKELHQDIKSIKAPSVAAAISGAKNELISPEHYQVIAHSEFQRKVASIWLQYQKNLVKYHAVDFDDLLIFGVELLRSSAGDRIRSSVDYVLIDEYQDTNQAQYLITKLLTSHNQHLTVVGDFSQSIYSWRGANYRNLMQLSVDYKTLTTVKLLTNYRSTQNILDAAYAVIAHNQMHPILELKTVNDEGAKIVLFEAHSEKDEAKFIADKIRAGAVASAVLYRTNAQSRAIEEELLRRGISYILVGGVKFYERREIKDLLAYLRVIANPRDEVSWQRVEGVGKRRRASFEVWLAQLKKDKADLVTVHTSDLLAGILNATDYLSLYDEKDENDLMRLENIKELASVASEFTDLTAFLENVALVQNEMTANLDQNGGVKVTLMTIHAAKGLEFDTVFMSGMEENLFPHARSLMDREQMEEERRLCYVAITRAKKQLFLTYARQRLYFGQRQQGTPSRFLAEIPINLVTAQVPLADRFGERRRLIPDWEIDQATANDFAEIDSW